MVVDSIRNRVVDISSKGGNDTWNTLDRSLSLLSLSHEKISSTNNNNDVWESRHRFVHFQQQDSVRCCSAYTPTSHNSSGRSPKFNGDRDARPCCHHKNENHDEIPEFLTIPRDHIPLHSYNAVEKPAIRRPSAHLRAKYDNPILQYISTCHDEMTDEQEEAGPTAEEHTGRTRQNTFRPITLSPGAGYSSTHMIKPRQKYLSPRDVRSRHLDVNKCTTSYIPTPPVVRGGGLDNCYLNDTRPNWDERLMLPSL